MRVRAGCELLLEASAPSPVVTMLRPREGQCLWWVDGKQDFPLQYGFTEYRDSFGNHCQRFVVPAGSTRLRIESVAEVNRELPVDWAGGLVSPCTLPADVLQFTLPSRYCTSDRPALFEQALSITRDVSPGYAQVEAIRAWIAQNIAYRHGISDTHSDALDTLAQRAGICRDFAHVGISLCRTLDIPARMVVGWLHGLEPMDLHAWFEAYVGDAWYAFDATQSEPKGGRIVIGHGRDAADVAFLMSYRPLDSVALQVWAELDQEAA
jgi:transglutaminase-like putative cysteine protease